MSQRVFRGLDIPEEHRRAWRSTERAETAPPPLESATLDGYHFDVPTGSTSPRHETFDRWEEPAVAPRRGWEAEDVEERHGECTGWSGESLSTRQQARTIAFTALLSRPAWIACRRTCQ